MKWNTIGCVAVLATVASTYNAQGADSAEGPDTGAAFPDTSENRQPATFTYGGFNGEKGACYENWRYKNGKTKKVKGCVEAKSYPPYKLSDFSDDFEPTHWCYTGKKNSGNTYNKKSSSTRSQYSLCKEGDRFTTTDEGPEANRGLSCAYHWNFNGGDDVAPVGVLNSCVSFSEYMPALPEDMKDQEADLLASGKKWCYTGDGKGYNPVKEEAPGTLHPKVYEWGVCADALNPPAPTEAPTVEPTAEPTIEPTAEPTEEPTEGPPTDAPAPTEEPTVEPTANGTDARPSAEPTIPPTGAPSSASTQQIGVLATLTIMVANLLA